MGTAFSAAQHDIGAVRRPKRFTLFVWMRNTRNLLFFPHCQKLLTLQDVAPSAAFVIFGRASGMRSDATSFS